MSSAAQPYLHATEPDEVDDVKEQLRLAIRAARQERSVRRREEAARTFAQVVGTIPELATARCVSVYASRPTEPGTGPLLEALHTRGVRVLMPVLGNGLQRDWAAYAGADDLRERAPGRPPEPSGPALGPDALADAEIIIVPALAVDTAGTRLGQGGGWYDRALAHARPGVRTVALVYPEELYEAGVRPLPREQHDRRVDAVATPDGWQCLR